MKSIKSLISKKAFWLFVGLTFASFSIFNGCKKNDNLTDADYEYQATEDAAQTVAGAVAVNSGGVMDQMSDALNTATTSGMQTGSTTISYFGTALDSVNKTYDSVTGWWTVTVVKKRGNPTGNYYAKFTRVYKHQFVNKNGQFQKSYIVGTDTAYTVNHKIVSGDGELKTPRLSHKLLQLSCDWIATGTNTTTVTINTTTSGPYFRKSSDTLNRIDGAVRTLNSELTVNFINVKGPRGSGLNWHQKTSGTLTGTYHAIVTFQKGVQYREKEINRTFTITLGGTKSKLDIGGKKYDLDLESGEIL